MIREWGTILPGWRWLYALQLMSDRPTGLEFRHRAAVVPTRETPVFIPGCRVCSDTEGVLNRGWDPILAGLPSFYRLRCPANQRRPMGLGFSYRARRCRPGRTLFSPPGCRICRDTEECMNRGWGPILPGLSSLYARQPMSGRPVGLGISDRAGRCRPGRTRFSSPGCRNCRDMGGHMNRGWGPIPPCCLRSTRRSQSAIGPWDEGFHTVRGGVDPGKIDFRPCGVVEIWKDS